MENEREFLNATDAVSRCHALMRRCGNFEKAGDFENALITAGRIQLTNLPDSLLAEAHYLNAFCSYLIHDYPAAENRIQQIDQHWNESLWDKKIFLLKILTLNELMKYDSAAAVAQRFVGKYCEQNFPDSSRALLMTLYEKENRPRFKSTNKAGNLSTFIPGSGQMYSGYAGEGLTSFGLVAASLAFTGYHAWIEHYITAFTLGSSLFQRFYFGGIARAEFLAEKKNFLLKKEYNSRLKEMLFRIAGP